VNVSGGFSLQKINPSRIKGRQEQTDMQLIKNEINHISNKKGFTLIEVAAVMVIMSVMVSVGIKKVDVLSHNAVVRVLESGLKELNTRETLVWAEIKLSDSGWINDTNVFSELDTNLGNEFKWTVEPNITGGILGLRSKSIVLTRIASTSSTVGMWNQSMLQ
jgi:prepilin-type N-terminal cleavage/methylation domain-containing protein